MPCAPILSDQEVSTFLDLLNPKRLILFIKFLLRRGKNNKLVIKRLIVLSPHFLLKDSV